MSLGPTFLSPFGDSADIGDDRALLNGALDEIRMLSVLSEQGPAPVTLWIARSATLSASEGALLIPRHVILAFAPGAVLTLVAGVTLDVQGRLDLGTERRFALGPGARVRLSGPLDEIHASWWGSDDLGAGGAPVLHALDALWDRHVQGLDPAPVCLSGPYLLDSTLRIAPPPSLAHAFSLPLTLVLRGRCHGSGDPMTFQVNDQRTVGAFDALVSVEGRVTLTLEHVGFDLTRLPKRPSVTDALLLTGEYDRSRVEACTFRFAGSTGIHLTAMKASVAGNAARLMISRSVFEGTGGAGVGIRVDPTAPTMLSISDSQFNGAFDHAISFAGSELAIFGCGFANRVRTSAADPQHASDIHLGPHGAKPSDVPELPGVNAHLTVTHCRSTSPTFLAGWPTFRSSDPGGAVLTGVLHEPWTSASEDLAASIHWGAGYSQRSLILQGCELGAPVRLDGGAFAGVVVEIGTRFEGIGGTRAHYIGGSADSVVRLFSPLEPPRL